MPQRIALFVYLAAASAAAVAQGFAQPPPPVVVERARLVHLAPSVEVPGTVVSRHDARLASELSAKLNWIAEVGTLEATSSRSSGVMRRIS